MKKQPLVSVITPCYNGETYVHRFFDSVLRQTYSNLELIFVNDGSSDKTEEIALRYKEPLEARGIQFTYIYQENAGQAAAVNQGLKLFQGDYLMLSDSDDWLTDSCVQKKLEYLERNPDKMFVLGKAVLVEENRPDKVVGTFQRKDTSVGWIFDDLIFEHDIFFAPGSYMFRSEAFLTAHPSRKIYESKGGQNWQLLLPMAYRYECGFLDEILYYILIHPDSHSRSLKRYEDHVQRTYEHQDILETLISGIDMPEEQQAAYQKRIRVKYIQKRLVLAYQYHKKAALEEEYIALCREEMPDKRMRRIYMYGKHKTLDDLANVIRIPVRAMKKVKGMIKSGH